MRVFLYALVGVFSAFGAQAQPSLCGNPPPVENETLKGDINGKAQILSRFLGDASLGGKIESSRTEIFSHYKEANERSNAYFEYMVCVTLMQDRGMTTSEKLDKLRSIRAEFHKPLPAEETASIKGMFARSDAPVGSGEGADARACVSAESGWKIKRGSGHLVEVTAFNASLVLGRVEETDDHFCQWFHVKSRDTRTYAILAMQVEAVQARPGG
jgi:hypothetical protein